MKSKTSMVAMKGSNIAQSCISYVGEICQFGYQKIQSAPDSPLAIFSKAIIKSPRKAGAIMPSGAKLAEAMARNVVSGNGLVIELGAGTGSVTEALITKGIKLEQIIAVEQSVEMSSYLRRRFPKITVIQGDAGRLSDFIPDIPIDTIVSSMPLVSLPPDDRDSIIRQIRQLASGRRFIQFTYFWGGSYLLKSGFKLLTSDFVLMNIPPARVMTFTV